MDHNIFSIFQGDAKNMNLKAAYEGGAGDPLDLTSCTEIDVALPTSTGTLLHLKLTTGEVTVPDPKNLGKFIATLSAINSALLNPGELQSFNVKFTIGLAVFTVKFDKALSVFSVS